MRTPTRLLRVGLFLAVALWLVIAGTRLLSPSTFCMGISYSGVTNSHTECSEQGKAPARPDPQAHQAISHPFAHLPLSFEANVGQADAQVRFIARAQGASVFLTSASATLSLGKARDASASLQMRWVGAAGETHPVGLDTLTGKVNYFVGNRPADWRTDIPTYQRVLYSELYPGIDLVYYGRQRQLEYDLAIQPGANPGIIQLELDGVDAARVDPEGNLVLTVAGGQVRLLRPKAYQNFGSNLRREIEVEYALRSHRLVAFRVNAYDRSAPLIIDPVVNFSTYSGGSENDDAAGIALDSTGNIYLVGSTNSPNFPTANARQGALPGVYNVWVAKVNSAGTALVYATYLGGSGTDYAGGIAVDGTGNAYVAGYTSSSNFPTSGAYQGGFAGGNYDGFVTKLNPSGSALIYSTYLGGSGDDYARGIAIDSSGNAYVAGETLSANFPTVSPLQPTHATALVSDAFVSKLNSGGSALIYSTCLGGALQDGAYGIALDSSGSAYVVGYTVSSDFPTSNPSQGSSGGTSDAFVAKLSPSGSSLSYSTYLGGQGQDFGQAIAVDASGKAYAVGQTGSTNFPTLNPLQASLAGGPDGFLSVFSPSGSSLVSSTFIGGSGSEYMYGVAVDPSGNIYVVGETSSPDFPTAAPIQVPGGGLDAVVVKLSPDGGSPDGGPLVYSTYFGGSGDDSARAVIPDSSGNAYVAGRTTSTDFPLASPIQQNNGGKMDAFVAKFSSSTALILLSVTPSSGPTGGGTTISLSGANFVSPAVVTLGGTPATGINVLSGGQITAQTPAHAAGAVNVVVSQADGGQTSTLDAGFTYVDLTDGGSGPQKKGSCGVASSGSSPMALFLLAIYVLGVVLRRRSPIRR